MKKFFTLIVATLMARSMMAELLTMMIGVLLLRMVRLD